VDAKSFGQSSAALVGDAHDSPFSTHDPAEVDEALEEGGAERPAEVGLLLAPVDAVADERPALGRFDADPQVHKGPSASVGEHETVGSACAEHRIAAGRIGRLDPERLVLDQCIQDRDPETPGQVVIARASPADRLGMGALRQGAGRAGRGETGQGLNSLRHLLFQADGRPAHLTRVHRALLGLDEHDRWRLGVLVDWTDVESFSGRRTKPSGHYADPEAAWGHRKGGGPGERDELFFGYYLSLATMVADEGGTSVPELVRRMNLVGCDHDPVPPMVGVLTQMAHRGIPLGDVVADSGYAHRVPAHFALPLRAAGASLVMDLHPSDRGTQGTHAGAVLHHGNLYCPMTPVALFGEAPLQRGASQEEAAAHDQRADELARYKLGRISGNDHDGYHRVACPALLGKVRCPLREPSMMLDLTRPEVTTLPEDPAPCCTQRTITVPASVNQKTAQRHDYPSAAWRRSYARRSAAERANARIKDPATIDVARGWCKIMGLVPMTLWSATAIVVGNLAVADAFWARHDDARRRAAAGGPPRTRRRRRTTLQDLAGVANAPP